MNISQPKSNTFVSLFKNIITYGFGKSAEQFAKFLLLPLYTRYLNPEDYGIIALVNLLSNIAGSIFGLGTQSSVFRFYKAGNNQSNSKLYYNSLVLLLGWTFLLLSISFLFKKKLSFLLFNNQEFEKHIMIGLLMTASMSFYNVPMFILRAEQKVKTFIKYNLGKLLVNVLLGVFFVVVLEGSALGALQAALLTTFLFAIFTNFKRIKVYKFDLSLNQLKVMLSYGYPLVLSGICMVFINSSDRYFLNLSFSLEEIGIYSVGYMIGSSINIFISSFQSAWPQMMFQISDSSDSSEKYSKIFTYYIFFIGIVWITLSAFSYELIYLMADHKFLKSYKIIPIVALSYSIYGATSITSAGIYIKNKTHNELILMPLVLFVCLASNYLLIEPYGYIGAAYATLISFTVMFFVYSLNAKKHIKINFETLKIFRLVVLFSFCFCITYFFQFENIWLGIIFKLLVILLLLFFTLSMKFFFYKDITLYFFIFFKN